MNLSGCNFTIWTKIVLNFFTGNNGKVNLQQSIIPRENNVVKDTFNGSVFPIARRYKNLRMTLEHGQWLSCVCT